MANFSVHQADLFKQAAEPNGGTIKFLLNERGIVFFPARQEHRDVKLPGLSYEHDYQGNAVAGILQNGKAEIRFHQSFSDERIKTIWRQAEVALPLLQEKVQALTYQGRLIK